MRKAIALFATAALASCRAPLYPRTALGPQEVAALGAKSGWSVERLVSSGVTLVGLERPPRDPGAPWILFFGGNGSSLASSQNLLARIAGESDVGLAVFAYRGYDGSGGAPSQRAMIADAARIAAHLAFAHGAASSHLALIGHSLGSGVAAALAARLARDGTPARALVLAAPFTSITRVANGIVPGAGCLVLDGWHTDRLAGDLPPPILLLHGTEDRVIPIRHARDLAASLGSKARLLEVPARGHNDVFGGPGVIEAIREVAISTSDR